MYATAHILFSKTDNRCNPFHSIENKPFNQQTGPDGVQIILAPTQSPKPAGGGMLMSACLYGQAAIYFLINLG